MLSGANPTLSAKLNLLQKKERDRNAPLSEEETYEREPRNQRPRSWRDVND